MPAGRRKSHHQGFGANKVLRRRGRRADEQRHLPRGHLQNSITLTTPFWKRPKWCSGRDRWCMEAMPWGRDAFPYQKPLLAYEEGKMNVKGQAFARYATANMEKSAHLDLNLGWEKFGSLTSITYSNFDDLWQGSRANPFDGDFWARTFTWNGSTGPIP
ncbi:MAG: hypothetical protein IPJ40_13395 [Saprospirales bacterium]|nr:hypothetical protein [Saprospirales bacterium]